MRRFATLLFSITIALGLMPPSLDSAPRVPSGLSVTGDSTPAFPLSPPNLTILSQSFTEEHLPTGEHNPETTSGAYGIVNVRNYGAVADGVADDTAEIQAAIDAASTLGVLGPQVYLPPGTYLISAPLIVKNGVHLRGGGRGRWLSTVAAGNVATIKASAAINMLEVVGVGGETGTQAEHVSITDLQLDGNSKLATGGIRIWNAREILVQNVQIRFTQSAFLLGRNSNLSHDVFVQVHLKEILASNNDRVLDGRGTEGLLFINIENPHFRSNAQEVISGPFSGVLTGGFFGGNAGTCLHLAHPTIVGQNFTIAGLGLENCGLDAYIDNYQNVNFIGGYMANSAGSSFARNFSIDIDNLSGGSIIGYQFGGNPDDCTGVATPVAKCTNAYATIRISSAARNLFIAGNFWEGITPPQVRFDASASHTTNVIHGGDTWHSGFVMRPNATGIQQLINAYQQADTVSRYMMTTDGRQEWGDGTSSRDTVLYRQAANILRTDDSFYTPGTASLPLLLTNTKIMSGTGTPEAVVTAPVGSLFLRTDGGAGTTMYIKETGTGNTGWVAK